MENDLAVKCASASSATTPRIEQEGLEPPRPFGHIAFNDNPTPIDPSEAAEAGFEPALSRLTVGHSAVKLLRKRWF